MEHLDYSLLPTQMRELIRIVGIEDAMRLLQAWGGQRKRVPMRPGSASHELLSILSPAGLVALCNSRFSGQLVDWPKPDKILRQSLHTVIRAARANGATVNELALRYGYTARRVRMIAPNPAKTTLRCHNPFVTAA